MRTETGWIQTFTGKQFWPLQPRREDVSIVDIAHHLANECRFTGATCRFYSVAQHSVLASRRCPQFPLWALLHDAAEAYLKDIPRPIKRQLPVLAEIEERVLKCIAEQFGLRWPIPPEVKLVDDRMLATERRDLMGMPPAQWVEDEQAEPFDGRIVPWTPTQATIAFKMRFLELTHPNPEAVRQLDQEFRRFFAPARPPRPLNA